MYSADNKDNSTQGTGKQAMLFFACFAIAAILWLFTTLSGTFESTLSAELEYDLPETQTTTRPLPKTSSILVQTTGWQLIREQFNERSLRVDIGQVDDHELLITNNHLGIFIEHMPSDIKVMHVSPDTISLHLEKKVRKKVPIKLTATYDNDQNRLDSLYLSPDSVIITGAKSIIQHIDYWPTEPVITYKDSIASGIAPLSEPGTRAITLSAVATSYSIGLVEPIKFMVSGAAFCPITKSSDTVYVYITAHPDFDRYIPFSALHMYCDHDQQNNAHRYSMPNPGNRIYNFRVDTALIKLIRE